MENKSSAEAQITNEDTSPILTANTDQAARTRYTCFTDLDKPRPGSR